MNSFGKTYCFEGGWRDFGLGSVRWISACAVALVVVSAFSFAPAETRAQEPRPWRRDGGISIRTIYDNNVFRLTDSQKTKVGSGSSKYADMVEVSDFIIQVGVGGELRHGPSSSRVRFGGGATLNAFTYNTHRTHVLLDAYVSRALGSSRNVIMLTVEAAPSEFRRNYLSGGDVSNLPIYQQGRSTSFGAEIEYSHRLIGGSGPDLDLEVGVLGGTRSVDGFEWRDRSSLGGRVRFDLKVNSDVGARVQVSRTRGAYTESVQPVLDLGLVSMVAADKDFDDTRLLGELRFDIGSDARLRLGYERRIRSYLAGLGLDPVYGGREDARNSYGAELRYDISNRVRTRIGGRYLEQVTFRPAKGSTGDEIDYQNLRLTFQLAYTR